MQAQRRALIPLTLVALTVFIAVLQQTITVLDARGDLIAAAARQEQPFADAVNFRNQLQALAVDTVKLANDGDPAAKAIVEALRQSGMSLPEAK